MITKGSSGTCVLAGWIAVLVGILCFVSSAPAAFGVSAPGASAFKFFEPDYPFCTKAVSSPYLQPLKKLPALREPPEVLPFAPSVRMASIYGPLVAKGKAIGFDIFASPSKGSKLNLQVVASISKVFSDGQGKALRQVTRSVDPGKEIRVGMSPPALGTYRVDVRFERQDGRHLQTYKQYFRVAPLKRSVRLGLSADTLTPGQSTVIRLENPGTAVVTTTFGYGIQRFNGTSWEPDPTLKDNRRPIRPLVRLWPASSYDCWRLKVPSEQIPGRYRIAKRVYGSGGPFVVHEFAVTSESGRNS